MGAANRVLKFKTPQIARQSGEVARLRALKGPDRGTIFVLRDSRVNIGRGEDSDVMIADLKASRLHAEISASPTGWQIRDLGSANGILVNSKVTRSAPLRSSDVITIGETVLEFLGAETGTQLLSAPVQGTQLIDAQVQSRLDQQNRARSLVDPFGVAGVRVAVPTGVGEASGTKKWMRLGGMALAGVLASVFFSLGEDPKKSGSARSPGSTAAVGSTSTSSQDLESILPKLKAPSENKVAERFFKQGFRDFKARNYIRARAQFDLVLQIVPEHEMAKRYRENCVRAIDDEVKDLLESGRRNLDAGKTRESKAAYESVVRLLAADQSNPAFVEAESQLKKMGTQESGEGVE